MEAFGRKYAGLSFLFGAHVAVETPGSISNPAVKHSGAECSCFSENRKAPSVKKIKET